jgi:hypothetical protein
MHDWVRWLFHDHPKVLPLLSDVKHLVASQMLLELSAGGGSFLIFAINILIVGSSTA